MKKYFSNEYIIRGIIIVILIAFASTKYEIKNVLTVLFIILGMTFLGISISNLYIELSSYIKTRIWTLSLLRTILYLLIIFIISLAFIFLLTPNLKIYSFLIVGGVLLCLLIIDLLRKLFK